MKIVAAAILRDGRIWTGKRHHLIMRQMAAELGPEIAPIDDPQGFVTEDGRFVDREEAARLAFQSGQMTRRVRTLFSEDLFKLDAPSGNPKEEHTP